MGDQLFTPTDVPSDLNHFEKLFKKLSTEYEMFFMDAVKMPPHRTIAEIEAIVRHYTKHPPRRTADRFRFNTLVHRYRTNMERWARRMRQVELEGGRRPAAGGHVRREDLDPNRPQVLAAVRAREGRPNGNQLRDLYLVYRQARRARGMNVSNLAYEPFARKLQERLEEARRRAGNRDLELRVDEVGGKVRLAVRPVRTRGRD